MIGSDNIRFGLFWGVFVGGYKGLLCLLRRIRQKEDDWNSFIAAFVASASLLIDAP